MAGVCYGNGYKILPAAAASGSSLVFKISLIFAKVNVVLSLFMKKPSNKDRKTDHHSNG
jgi:hypothetical protein